MTWSIDAARISIGGHDEKITVSKGDKGAVFELKLNKEDVKLQTWFYDKQGRELCGAYYVYVKRL